MNMPVEIWDLVKMLFCAYVVYVLNKTDRNQNEIFKRLLSLEKRCAAHHGLHGSDE